MYSKCFSITAESICYSPSNNGWEEIVCVGSVGFSPVHSEEVRL